MRVTYFYLIKSVTVIPLQWDIYRKSFLTAFKVGSTPLDSDISGINCSSNPSEPQHVPHRVFSVLVIFLIVHITYRNDGSQTFVKTLILQTVPVFKDVGCKQL
jgi:hypothetical protein